MNTCYLQAVITALRFAGIKAHTSADEIRRAIAARAGLSASGQEDTRDALPHVLQHLGIHDDFRMNLKTYTRCTCGRVQRIAAHDAVLFYFMPVHVSCTCGKMAQQFTLIANAPEFCFMQNTRVYTGFTVEVNHIVHDYKLVAQILYSGNGDSGHYSCTNAFRKTPSIMLFAKKKEYY